MSAMFCPELSYTHRRGVSADTFNCWVLVNRVKPCRLAARGITDRCNSAWVQ